MWFLSRRFLLVLSALVCVAACSDLTFTSGGPVAITLSANRTTVAAGGSVTFTYDVKGTFLNGVIIDYGDGVADSVPAQGAQTAAGSVSHSFGAVGAYTVVGRAEDNTSGTATAEVVITVEES